MKRLLLVDFDGVIADTFELCLGIREKLGNPIAEDEYRTLFEGNIYEESKKRDQKLSKKTKSEEQRRAKGDWYDYYTPGLVGIDPIKGMPDVIKKLSDSYTLVIVSSTANKPIEDYLKKHSLLQYFDKVFGSDVDHSKVVKMNMIFDEYRIKPSDCLFITDTLGDMREAERVEVKALGLPWGYHSKETLERGDFFDIIEKPSEIIPAVEKYFRYL